VILPAIEATACKYGGDYPFCQPAPGPNDGDTEPTHTPDGGNTGGGTIDLNEGQCPSDDPNCKQPLEDEDRASLDRALGLVDRNADPVCAQLADQLASLGTSHVFRGAYDSGYHTGEAGNGDIHIDPRIWNQANSQGGSWDAVLAEALLHEVAHLLYGPHTGETTTPYHTYPYDHMHNPNSGVPQCVP
jgi:hypothetical protein